MRELHNLDSVMLVLLDLWHNILLEVPWKCYGYCYSFLGLKEIEIQLYLVWTDENIT